MTPDEFELTLIDALHESLDFQNDLRSVRTYNDAGILTRDFGLVVTLNDGSEYQITIVQSAYAEKDA